jgi:flavin-dependent dehydrogenase
MPTLETEICVVGGGPAGSTLALKLAELGHQVCLIEKSSFPRRHVGESIPADIVPLWRWLGLWGRLEGECLLRSRGSVVLWSGEGADYRANDQPGFLVDRGKFDQLLLQAAVEAGAALLQPAQARRSPEWTGATWRIPIRYRCEDWTVAASFLALGTGRSGLLPGRRMRRSRPTLAIYAYWRDVRFRDAKTRVEAGTNRWYWGAPLPDGLFNAMVFLDPRHASAACAASGTAGGAGIDRLYRSLLSESMLLRECLEGKVDGRVLACDASSYEDATPVGANFIRVGEAAFAVDPLSSQGVQAAFQSAVHASAVVHTLRLRPGCAEPALRFYRDQQRRASSAHHAWANHYFSARAATHPLPFWRQRASATSGSEPRAGLTTTEPLPRSCRISLSSVADLIEVPVVQDDFVSCRLALRHPSLERPVAFLTGCAAADLVSLITPGLAVEEAARRISRYLQPKAAWRLLEWFWARRIIVPVEGSVQLPLTAAATTAPR